MSAEWSIFVAANTVDGEISLRMTQQQAEELTDSLKWLMEGE